LKFYNAFIQKPTSFLKMKKLIKSVVFFSILLVGCSLEKNEPSPTKNPTYFPANSGQYWIYEVTSDDTPINRDSLYVFGEEQINKKTYHKLKSRRPSVGFYSSALNNNSIREESGKLMLTGSFSIPGFENLLDLDLRLDDFIIFDKNASNDQQMSMISGEAQQNLGDIPLIITCVVKSNALNSLPSFTAANGKVYNNVIPMKLTFKLDIKATIGPPLSPIPIPITVAVLDAQDVAVSTSYYVEDIGVVQTETNLQYQLNSLILTLLTELPIPASGSTSSLEKLVFYFKP
jgi:hypothetical protein